MKRYELKDCCPCGQPWREMEESLDGDYILFSDLTPPVVFIHDHKDLKTACGIRPEKIVEIDKAAEAWAADEVKTRLSHLVEALSKLNLSTSEAFIAGMDFANAQFQVQLLRMAEKKEKKHHGIIIDSH